MEPGLVSTPRTGCEPSQRLPQDLERTRTIRAGQLLRRFIPAAEEVALLYRSRSTLPVVKLTNQGPAGIVSASTEGDPELHMTYDRCSLFAGRPFLTDLGATHFK